MSHTVPTQLVPGSALQSAVEQDQSKLSKAISARRRRRIYLPDVALLSPLQKVIGNKAGAKPIAWARQLGQGVSISPIVRAILQQSLAEAPELEVMTVRG